MIYKYIVHFIINIFVLKFVMHFVYKFINLIFLHLHSSEFLYLQYQVGPFVFCGIPVN